MAEMYYRLIKAGKWTIERVPEKWRAEVEEMLKEGSMESPGEI